MNYKIIMDQQKLIDFIDWLPELDENEKFYVSLLARKKYCKDDLNISSQEQLGRFVSKKDNLFEKIKRLECEVGTLKSKDIVLPQDSLALYINPNPRCMKRATFQLIKKCVDLLENNGKGYNVHAEALSCIQRSKSKSHFCDFDIDSKDVDLNLLDKILPSNSYSVIETRGGYHVLVKTRIAPKSKWHVDIRNAFEVDNVGDQLVPVVGCCQGGFTPAFITNET